MSLAARYRNVQVETATPARAMMMLFEAAMRNMAKAREALAAGDYASAIATIDKAATIVLNMDAVLKHEAAPELCAQLHEIYQFVVGRLNVAAVSQNPRLIEESERVLRPIVEAFGNACDKAPAAPQP